MRPYDTIKFSGAAKTYETIDAEAIVTAGQVGNDEKYAVTIQADGHGFLAGPTVDDFTCVYILNTTSYDGLRRIQSVATNSLVVYAPFTAETPEATDTLRTAYASKYPYEFLGFNLHLNTACATAENLIIALDSAKGSSFDVKLYTKAMNTVQDIHYMFSEPYPIDANDVIDLTWANANSRIWTIKFFVRSRV